MMRIRWAAWKALPRPTKRIDCRSRNRTLGHGGGKKRAVFTHRPQGDLLLVHFRSSFDELNRAELQLARLGIADYLETTTSYLSVVELDSMNPPRKVYSSLAEKGIAPHSPEWKAEIQSVIARQKEAMYPRLYPDVPPHKYICFYPMDRRRGEAKNWYQVPMAERQAMMHEHGMIGRRYAGEVKQIITRLHRF